MRKNSDLYLMIIPSVILFLVFLYVPMAGLIIAFRKYDIVSGLFGSGWVGFKNFELFFSDVYFVRILRNTVVLNVWMLLIAFPMPIVLALMINEIRGRRVKRIFQSVSYLPHFVATVIVVGLMMELLGSRGLVNQVISSLGMKKILFFQDASWFRSLYVGSSVWEGTGWRSILYVSALGSINPSLYESADIDGATRFQKIRFITIRGIMPTIVILFILAIGNMMSVGFEKVFLMYSPSTYETGDVINTYVYRRGIIGMDYSYSTAVGLFNSIVNFVLLIGANTLSRKVGDTSLW